ncbi:isocitrate lyase/PEP mutase family protein [Actinoplanes sp. NPDC023801]|uniref:isocitrate lyase/PEP mutase family protein n=1 Tax=Actinoplanes sp. NPDC023801 TaxID=3154595 RepID=UPI0033E5B4A2
MTATALRAILASGRVTHVPGIYDPLTAALAVAAGHRAVHLSGAAVSAIMLSRPGVGAVNGTQIADRASTLVPALDGIPLIADADTGYATPPHAVWTALAYSRAGIAGLHLGDRVTPKGYAHPAGRELIGIGEAAAKITALAGQAPEIVVIARTDAYPAQGLDETIVRCRAYADAGADAVLPAGVGRLDELRRLHEALPGVPLVVDRSEAGGDRPAANDAALTEAALTEAGVRLVLHPVAALLAAVRAASLVYRSIADTGTAGPADRMPWAAITALAGQDEAVQHEARYVPRGLDT